MSLATMKRKTFARYTNRGTVATGPTTNSSSRTSGIGRCCTETLQTAATDAATDADRCSSGPVLGTKYADYSVYAGSVSKRTVACGASSATSDVVACSANETRIGGRLVSRGGTTKDLSTASHRAYATSTEEYLRRKTNPSCKN